MGTPSQTDGTFAAAPLVIPTEPLAADGFLLAMDVDGDGKLDIVTVSLEGGAAALQVVHRTAAGEWAVTRSEPATIVFDLLVPIPALSARVGEIIPHGRELLVGQRDGDRVLVLEPQPDARFTLLSSVPEPWSRFIGPASIKGATREGLWFVVDEHSVRGYRWLSGAWFPETFVLGSTLAGTLHINPVVATAGQRRTESPLDALFISGTQKEHPGADLIHMAALGDDQTVVSRSIQTGGWCQGFAWLQGAPMVAYSGMDLIVRCTLSDRQEVRLMENGHD